VHHQSNYISCLPGVPSVESPFFDELFDETDPRYPIAVALRDKGFAVIDFPDPDLGEMADRIRTDLHPLYDWDNWNGGRQADMRRMDTWEDHPDVRRIASNRQILDLLTYLYGRTAFPFQTLNFPVGTQQHFHTDSVHFSSKPERFMCGVWVALEDIGPDQGPLLYYPGSHKWPIYTREHIGERYTAEGGRSQEVFEPLWERLVEKHGVAPERFYPRKGQALIWAANLLHGGDRHIDRTQTRWSQVSHYYFDDCVYYTPLASNEPAGDYFRRAPVDILTNKLRPSSYLGAVLDEDALQVHPSLKMFDPERYLRLNPDVAAAGVNPLEHYIQYGRAEKRLY
jgi:hypothetical protein